MILDPRWRVRHLRPGQALLPLLEHLVDLTLRVRRVSRQILLGDEAEQSIHRIVDRQMDSVFGVIHSWPLREHGLNLARMDTEEGVELAIMWNEHTCRHTTEALVDACLLFGTQTG